MVPAPVLAEQKKLIEFAAKAAENFVSAYYQATDAPHRVQLIPTLYLPESTIVWNGHPIGGSASLAALLGSMPGTKHEVQAFDCHPISGGTQAGE
jgi:NTF2-related export protein 1/2